MNTQVNQTETTETETTLDMDQVKQMRFFDPDELEAGFDYLSALQGTLESVEFFSNFKRDDDGNVLPPPEGMGLLILPMQRRPEGDEVGLQLTGIAANWAPTFEAAIDNPKGAEAVYEATLGLYARKIRAAINGADDGSPIIFPETIDQYFERVARGESLQAFTKVVKGALEFLKSKGFKKLDAGTLRQILSNATFAAARYPKLPQSSWIALMDLMAESAKKQGLDPAIYDTWKRTRDDAQLEEIDELDLSGLGLIEAK